MEVRFIEGCNLCGPRRDRLNSNRCSLRNAHCEVPRSPARDGGSDRPRWKKTKTSPLQILSVTR
jgi:hypothetical protein